ncbi:MAG: transglutaminase-like cysteine peptidase [Candidatus Omnitrophica bacterium]|nr:transglutaminase-like cysteine peptidase [Candidatus Omnitrophota bacterium]
MRAADGRMVGLMVAAGLWMAVMPCAAEEARPVCQPGPCLPRPRDTRVAQAPAPTTSLDRLAERYTTPRAIAAFLHDRFTFVHDQEQFGVEERWQAPEEFARRHAGDCEDYANFARHLLVRNGYAAYVFSLFGDGGYAHTVCIFVDEHGRYNVINQDRVQLLRAPSLEALAAALCPAWTFGGIAEQAGTRGQLVQRITNAHPVAASDFDEVATAEFAP